MSGVRIPPPRPLFPRIATGVSGASSSRAVSSARALMVAVAHQVEHRIVAPEVAGSRPVSHPNNHVGVRGSETVLGSHLSVLKS